MFLEVEQAGESYFVLFLKIPDSWLFIYISKDLAQLELTLVLKQKKKCNWSAFLDILSSKQIFSTSKLIILFNMNNINKSTGILFKNVNEIKK